MAEVQAKAIDLNEKIIDAQHRIFEANAAQSELVEHIRQLEGQITRMKDWDAQKQRYRLAAPFPGCMVYALQESVSEGQPAHYLCTACFQNGHASILQSKEGRATKEGHVHSSFSCPACKAEAFTRWNNAVSPQYFEEIQPKS